MAKGINPLSLSIARLRAAGCKVSTVIGHDPAIGDWIYSVTLPPGVLHDPHDPSVAIGAARIEVRNDDRRLIVKACAYRMGQVTSEAAKRNNLADIAETFQLLADEVEAATFPKGD